MKKRLLVFLLSLSLCLSLGVSVNAASTQNSFDGKDFIILSPFWNRAAGHFLLFTII